MLCGIAFVLALPFAYIALALSFMEMTFEGGRRARVAVRAQQRRA
jgi:hypothetical protein